MRKPPAVFAPNAAQPRPDLANAPQMLMRFSSPSVAQPRLILAFRAAYSPAEGRSALRWGATRLTETTEHSVGAGQRRLPSFDFVTREMTNFDN